MDHDVVASVRPTELFEFTTDTDPLRLGARVLHVALDGFMDAGAVGAQVSKHVLKAAADEETIVRFDADLLHDYRSRRPRMIFERDHWSGYDEPTLELKRLHDVEGTPFLLLTGAEPDLAWGRFVEAVRMLSRTLGVRRMVSAHGIPMAVPHTRPIGVTRYSSDPDLLAPQAGFGVVEVPAAVEALLHLRLGEHDIETVGVAVHVPHYIADSEYVDGAVTALRELGRDTDLVLPFDALVQAAAENRAQIDAGVDAAPEAGELIGRLEQQYDRVLEGRQRRGMLAAQVGDLPSAEEIGAEFEEFLREESVEDPAADSDEDADADDASDQGPEPRA